jgi:antitoxin component of MazEF toxin-antitoxin module
MIKTLTPIGNGFGLVIERPMLELLKIDGETPLEIRTDGETLIIRPVRETHRDRVQASAEKIMTQHASTLAKLAK